MKLRKDYGEVVTFCAKPSLAEWTERVVLLMAVLYFCAHSLPRAWRTLNTDFPNYYLAARLAREGIDTSRMYEWTWIQRQKDYASLDIRVIGLLPITPFSTLIFWPLSMVAALTAKHIWTLLNLALLVPIAWMLRKLTGLGLRRIALALFLSFPLYRNLLYGQFYIFLLFLIVAACVSYLHGYRALAGALVAIAGVSKAFPILLLVLFIRRRDWRALAFAVITACLCVAVSVAAIGLNANRVWLIEILPWVVHGEGLGTYTANSSFAGILHCLFLNEPQWNAHLWYRSPLAYAVLLPLLSMLVLAPAVLLINRMDQTAEQIVLEWSSLVTVSLAISSIPASYNFVLILFPVCVLAGVLLRRRLYGWLSGLLVAYLGIGFPIPVPEHPVGLTVLLYAPRLALVLGIAFGIYALQWRNLRRAQTGQDWTLYAWLMILTAAVLLSIRSTYFLEQGEREEFAYRVPIKKQGFANTYPQSDGRHISFIRFSLSGYELETGALQGSQSFQSQLSEDTLSFAAAEGDLLVERVPALASGQYSPHTSRIIDLQNPSKVIVEDAHDPMSSRNNQDLAFLRDDHGRARLVLRRDYRTVPVETVLTSERWNVYEASFLSEEEYAIAAVQGNGRPRIFLTDSTHRNEAVSMPNSRYPALSPDGRWMAYSHLDRGVWNLWLRDEISGAISRIADVPCNQLQPSWEDDSKTLVYGTDCGRSIWFTAVARRRVIP